MTEGKKPINTYTKYWPPSELKNNNKNMPSELDKNEIYNVAQNVGKQVFVHLICGKVNYSYFAKFVRNLNSHTSWKSKLQFQIYPTDIVSHI